MSLAGAIGGFFGKAKGFITNLLSSNALVGQIIELIGGFLERVINVGMNEDDLSRVEALDSEIGQLINAKEREIDGLQNLRVALRAAIDPAGESGPNMSVGEGIEIVEALQRNTVELAATADELKDVYDRVRDLLK